MNDEQRERRALRDSIAAAAMGAMLTMRSQMENVRTMGKEIAREAYDFADVMLAEADMRNMSEDEARDDDDAGELEAAARIDEMTDSLRAAHDGLNAAAVELYRSALCGKPCCGNMPCERQAGHGPSSADNAGHECPRCEVPF